MMNEVMSRLRFAADALFHQVIKRIVESGKPVTPVVIGLRRSGRFEFTGIEFESDEAKEAAYHTVCQRMWKLGCLGVISINDTWVSTAVSLPVLIRPRFDPDRQEAIVLAIRTRKGEQEVQLLPYERRPDGITWHEKQVFTEAEIHLLEAFKEEP